MLSFDGNDDFKAPHSLFFAAPLSFSAQVGGDSVSPMTWIVLGILIIILIGLWLALRWSERDFQPVPDYANIELASKDAAPPTEMDDLTKIEGIGPKISELLRSSGIHSFQQLAQSDAEDLERLLDDAGLAMTAAGAWPSQALLAAQGDWQALEALQEELKGGRREA